MSALWLVEIGDDEFREDCFVSGAVWANSAKEAEQLIRGAQRKNVNEPGIDLPRGIETKLIAKPAPTEGIVLQHWHAG